MLCRTVLLFFVIALPTTLRATVIVPAEFREIVNGADIIAYGRVIDTKVDGDTATPRAQIPGQTPVTLQLGGSTASGSSSRSARSSGTAAQVSPAAASRSLGCRLGNHGIGGPRERSDRRRY